MRGKVLSKLGALLIGVALAVPVGATVINFRADMDGAQANAGAGTGSTATGLGIVTLDDVSNLLSWDISWTGLLGTLTVAHFHGPALPGANAGVQVNFLALGPGNPSVGSTNITSAQAADLLAGLWYINVHSSRNPGGEIRGQVLQVSEPAVALLMAAGVAALVLVRRNRARSQG